MNAEQQNDTLVNLAMQDAIADLFATGGYRKDAVAGLARFRDLGSGRLPVDLHCVICSCIEDYFDGLGKFLARTFPAGYWKELAELRAGDQRDLYQTRFVTKINELYLTYTKHVEFVKFFAGQLQLSGDHLARLDSEFVSAVMRSARMNTLANCVFFIKYFST